MFLNVLAFEFCFTRVGMQGNERREEFWNLISRTALCELYSFPCAWGGGKCAQRFLCRAKEVTRMKSHNSPQTRGLFGLREAPPDASALPSLYHTQS